MKKTNLILTSALALSLTIGLNSCKPKDADVKAAIEKAIQTDGIQGMTVNVEKGVATISGMCADEMMKEKCASVAKAIKGVNEVINNCTITPPAPPAPPAPVVEVPTVSAVEQGVKDALKDFPTVTYALTQGAVALTGEIAKSKWPTLMQTLSGLNLKVDSKGLTKK